MSHVIDVEPAGRRVRVAEGTLLADALRKAGLSPVLYCRGMGVCGKCAVEILEGRLPDFAAGEREILARSGLSERHRLSCRHDVRSSLRVRVPDDALPGRISVLEFGPEVRLPFEPAVKKFAVDVPPPAEGDETTSWVESLLGSIGAPSLDVPLDVLRKWPAAAGGRSRRLTAVVRPDEALLDVEPGDTSNRLFGLAFDVGTTTLAAALVDLTRGRVLSRDACLNGQAAYGADVITRINLVLEKPSRADTLRKTVLSDLAGLAKQLLDSARVEGREVLAACLAGNTAMSHLLLGLPVETLSVAPYASLYSVLPVLSPAEAGLPFLHPRASVYVAPNIKSFVGGDTSAGLAASGFARVGEPALFIDLGTNGEIVLKAKGRLSAASTAAGPAFEGMNISCGMLARTGAICRAEAGEDGFRLETVDGAPPRGLCGTGLIDVAAVALAKGLITPSGAVVSPHKTVSLARGLSLTQRDVRELQLAVGAVKAGMKLMLGAHSLRAADLKSVHIAGAFGSRLSVANSVALGLLPDIPPARFRFLGNASLAGAVAMIVSSSARRAAEKTAGSIRHFSLAAQPGFQDIYISSLEFKQWR